MRAKVSTLLRLNLNLFLLLLLPNVAVKCFHFHPEMSFFPINIRPSALSTNNIIGHCNSVVKLLNDNILIPEMCFIHNGRSLQVIKNGNSQLMI